MSLEVVSAAPHLRLRRFVTRYHGYTERTGAPLTRPELPHGGVTVIVNLGPALTVDGTTVGSFAATPSAASAHRPRPRSPARALHDPLRHRDHPPRDRNDGSQHARASSHTPQLRQHGS